MPSVRSEPRDTATGRVLIATIERPEVHNAVNADVLTALEELARRVGSDTSIRAVIITGAGERAFSAGADISTFTGLDAVGAEALMQRGQQVFQEIEDLPVPVIAAINGYALGGGLELALACDVRIAAVSARMGQPEATLANLPGWGGTQRLPRAVGEARAKELIFSGRLITASEAERYGLVQAVSEPNQLLADALHLAESLLPAGRTAVSLAKGAIHAARGGGPAGYAVERHAVAVCFTTPEQQAAVGRFLDKRRA